jgi:hypothetical protein
VLVMSMDGLAHKIQLACKILQLTTVVAAALAAPVIEVIVMTGHWA